MRKSYVAKVTGFVGTTAATAALLGFAVAGTGAYFTDTEEGAIAATVGTIAVSAPDAGNVVLQEILPGEKRSYDVAYSNDGVSAQDVYVVMTDEHFAAVQHEGSFTVNGTVAKKDVPIKVASGLAAGKGDTITFAYTLDAHLTDQKTYVDMFGSGEVDYKVVATQVGVAPGA